MRGAKQAIDRPAMSHRILIADDDRLVRESLCEVLDAFGAVTVADCGASALAEMRRHSVDLLVSDVDMPDLTGFQLLEWVRSQPPPAPAGAVLLLSARADDALAHRAMAAGAVAMLAKPVAVAHITALVSNVLH
jgi:CheY-like chemotaxis protein